MSSWSKSRELTSALLTRERADRRAAVKPRYIGGVDHPGIEPLRPTDFLVTLWTKREGWMRVLVTSIRHAHKLVEGVRCTNPDWRN